MASPGFAWRAHRADSLVQGSVGISAAIAFLILIRWLPDLSSHGEQAQVLDPSLTTLTILVSGVAFAAVLWNSRAFLLGLSHAPRVRGANWYTDFARRMLYGFAGYVLLASVFRDQPLEEVARSLVLVAMLLSADSVARLLLHHPERLREFAHIVDRTFSVCYVAAIAIAIAVPSSVWWGHGLFGDGHPRSWFWFLSINPVIFLMFRSVLHEMGAGSQSRMSSGVDLSSKGGWSQPLAWVYNLLPVVVIVLAVSTRTRSFVITIAAFAGVYLLARRSQRVIIVGLIALSIFLMVPSVGDQVLEQTRISAFLNGFDPTSGRIDPTNGRSELASELAAIFGEDIVFGAGSANVRQRVADLPLSSEAGILFHFASYGLGTVLFAIYLLTGFAAAVSAMIRGTIAPGLMPFVAMTVVAVPAASFIAFSSASSLFDWFALLAVAVTLNMPATRAVARETTRNQSRL